MARARSPNSIEAEEMYKNGMKLVDIAKKLDVPASTVRRWKSTQNWDGKTKGKKNERSQKKKANARHKGGQPGNRNAVGNKGGPLKPGDKIAEKHGAYSSVYWDVLDESEKDMIEDIPMDEEMLLIEQIQLFAVRERRIMIAINKYRNMKGEVSLYGFNRSESKRTFKTEEDKQLYEERIEKKISAEERLPGDMYNMQTTMENKDNMIARLEKELSTVQSKKTKAIEALAKLRLEKQKIAGESKGNEVVRAWAEAVVKAREKYNNLTTAMWASMRDLLDNKQIVIEDDEQTIGQLSSRKYTMTSNGKLEIESKKEMKKRGLDSPDRADALALALYLGKIKKHTGTAPGVKELQELTKDNYWG